MKTAVLAGPTAAGKTALALEMAGLRPDLIEIINADSMQVYRGMDIGTAKPTNEELARVPHHLIDIRDPHEPFTAGEFRRATLAALEDIHARGKRALIVGGTGFYLRALFFGIWDGPPADPAIRARLEACDLTELHSRLTARDPESAVRIGLSDRYRLTRALELIEQIGKTPTELEKEMSGAPHPGLELWVVDRNPSELERRLSQRTELMIEQGFVEEVRRLTTRYLDASPRSLGAVGYREVCAYLAGHAPKGRKIPPGLPGLRQEIDLANRQLVKKQRTWFRSLGQRLGAAAKSFQLPSDSWKPEFDRLYPV
jgi:tRNA dimethylallyltransferase